MDYLIQSKLIVESGGEKGVIGFAGSPPQEVRKGSGQWIGRKEGADYRIPHRPMVTDIGIHREDTKMTLRGEGKGVLVFTLFRQQGSLHFTYCDALIVTKEGRVRSRQCLDEQGALMTDTLAPGEGLRVLYTSRTRKGEMRGFAVALDLFPEGARYPLDAEAFGFGQVRQAGSSKEEMALFGLLDSGVEREVRPSSPELEK